MNSTASRIRRKACALWLKSVSLIGKTAERSPRFFSPFKFSRIVFSLAHPQFCGATFTIFKCRHSLREFPGFVGSANACFFYQRMKDFPAAFAAVLIKGILGRRAVAIHNPGRSPSRQGATRGHPTKQELGLHLGPVSPTR